MNRFRAAYKAEGWGKHHTIIAIIVLLWMPDYASAQRLTFTIQAGRTDYLIGEHVPVWLEVSADRMIHVDWPALPDTLGEGVMVLNRGHIDSSMAPDGIVHYRQQIIVSAFDSGLYLIDSIPLTYLSPGAIQPVQHYPQPPLLLRFSMPNTESNATIRDIKGPFNIPVTLWEVLVWMILILAPLYTVWYLYRRFRKKPNRVVSQDPTQLLQVMKSPVDKALERLYQLKASDTLERAGEKAFFVMLTEILRTYIHEAHGVEAPELTTRQTMRALQYNPAISQEQHQRLDVILHTADLVKFARFAPTQDESMAVLEEAILFVSGTAPVHVITQQEEVTP